MDTYTREICSLRDTFHDHDGESSLSAEYGTGDMRREETLTDEFTAADEDDDIRSLAPGRGRCTTSA
jgi:hypothetical protein